MNRAHRNPRPGYFAGAFAFWGVENREAPVRYIPGSALLGAGHANVELKTSDASANPYLALAALLAAGFAGIADDLEGIAALPVTQGEQEEALRDSRVADALGPEVLGAFLAVRRSDAAAAAGMEVDDMLAGLRFKY